MKFLFKLTFLIIFLLTGLSADAFPQQEQVLVESITFSGNKLISNRSLLEYGGITLPGAHELNSLSIKIQNVLNLYRDKGYYYAQIKSVELISERNYVTVHVEMDEGPLFRLGEVTIIGAGDSGLSEIRDFIPGTGAIYRKELIESLALRIRDYFEDSGYPYASINVENTFRKSNRIVLENIVDVTLSLTKNKFVRIDTLAVSGLENTNAKVILRESRIYEGDLYNGKKVAKAKNYIQNLSFLDDVSVPELFELPDGRTLLRFVVQEKRSNKFTGLAGYVPGSGRSDSYIVGSFTFDFGNLFGTGRVFQAEWHKPDRSSQEVKIFYEEPWIFGLPVNINGLIEQSIQDSSYTKRSFIFGLNYRLNSALTAHASVGREQVIADVEVSSSLAVNSNSSFLTAGLSFDNLDYRINPRKGVYYSTFVTRQDRTLAENNIGSIDPDISDRKIKAQIELAFPVTKNVISFIKGVWNQTTTSGDKVPISQQWFMGGTGSVRGYREKQFLASKVAWLNMELRYLLNRESRAYVFLDSGFFQDKNESTQSRIGYGFGIRIDSQIGNIGFDIGLGKGDAFSSMKIHFLLQNAF